MKIPLTFYLSEKFIRKDGTCPIYIQYNYNQKSRPLLSTKIHIPPAFWDKKSSRIRQTIPSEFGFADDLNYQLKKIFRIAEDIVVFTHNKQVLNPDIFVKRTFQPDFDVLSLQNMERKIDRQDVFYKRGKPTPKPTLCFLFITIAHLRIGGQLPTHNYTFNFLQVLKANDSTKSNQSFFLPLKMNYYILRQNYRPLQFK